MPENDKDNRSGVNASLYLTHEADGLLDRVADATRRSRSDVVSLMLEMYGPELLTDPGRLITSK